MKTICRQDCCDECPRLKECGGCEKCNGHPFGGECVAANCILSNGYENFEKLKNELIKDINSLNIEELHVDDLFLLNGAFVNLEYEIEGNKHKFLKDNNVYFGNQIERKNNGRCYGVVCNENFILVSEYGCNGSDSKLVILKNR